MDIAILYTQRPGSPPRGFQHARGYRLVVEADDARVDLPILTVATGVRGRAIPPLLEPDGRHAVLTWWDGDRMLAFTLA